MAEHHQLLRDPQLPTIERVIVARRLAEHDSQVELDALLDVAHDASEHEWLCDAAGESIAEILWRRGALDQAPLWDFTGAAYPAFDETVARHERFAGMRQ